MRVIGGMSSSARTPPLFFPVTLCAFADSALLTLPKELAVSSQSLCSEPTLNSSLLWDICCQTQKRKKKKEQRREMPIQETKKSAQERRPSGFSQVWRVRRQTRVGGRIVTSHAQHYPSPKKGGYQYASSGVPPPPPPPSRLAQSALTSAAALPPPPPSCGDSMKPPAPMSPQKSLHSMIRSVPKPNVNANERVMSVSVDNS